MALTIPPELKKIGAFVRRAEELDKDTTSAESRLVAYYCRQYAVHTGIPLASASPAAKECLGVLLGQLEKEKPAMDNFTREEAKFVCESFAERIFKKADDEDLTGAANKGTARTFYAAASFLQILDQFSDGEEDPERQKKIVYAKWKATEILKALKEGRTPTPGGFGEDEEEEKEEKSEEATGAPFVETVQDDDDEGAGITMAPPAPPVQPPPPPPAEEEGMEVSLDQPPPPPYPVDEAPASTSFVAPPPPPSPPTPTPPPPAPSAPLPPAAVAPPKKSGGLMGFMKKKPSPSGKLTRAEMDDAMELTRFALAALEDKDVDLAANRLQQALQTLGR